MNKITLYQMVYNSLKTLIKDGIYPVDTFLPTETELCEEYSVSRTTIRKALGRLHQEGYVKITQGRGTEVLSRSTTQDLSHISSITETLKSKGYVVTIHGMQITKITIPDFLLEVFKLPGDSFLYKVERLVYADDKPIAYIINYLDANLLPDFEQYVNSFVSLYDFLQQKYNIILTDAVETLSAVNSDFTESHLLQLKLESPLLCSKRVSSINGVNFEYGISKLDGTRYEYTVFMKGR